MIIPGRCVRCKEELKERHSKQFGTRQRERSWDGLDRSQAKGELVGKVSDGRGKVGKLVLSPELLVAWITLLRLVEFIFPL